MCLKLLHETHTLIPIPRHSKVILASLIFHTHKSLFPNFIIKTSNLIKVERNLFHLLPTSYVSIKWLPLVVYIQFIAIGTMAKYYSIVCISDKLPFACSKQWMHSFHNSQEILVNTQVHLYKNSKHLYTLASKRYVLS